MEELDQLWTAYRHALDATIAAELAWHTFRPGALPWATDVTARWDQLYVAQQGTAETLAQAVAAYRAAKIRHLTQTGGAA